MSMTSIKYAHLQVMAIISGKFHQNPLKTVGVAETRLTAEKLLKGHNSGKNQSSMTSIKYAHLQVMGTITGKFHQNSLKTVDELRRQDCVYGRTDGRTQNYSPLRLTSGDKNNTAALQLFKNIQPCSLKSSQLFKRVGKKFLRN